MPTKINVTAETEKELSVFKGQATKLNNMTAGFVIKTEQQHEKANELLLSIKKNERELNAKKKKITDPLNTALKEVRDLFKPVEHKLGASKVIVTDAILTYRRKVAEEAAAKQAELEAKVDAGEIDIDEAIDQAEQLTETQKTTHTKKGSVTVRTIKDIEITDVTKIPEDYFVLDMVRLKRDALGVAAQGIAPIEIPGVKVIEKESI